MLIILAPCWLLTLVGVVALMPLGAASSPGSTTSTTTLPTTTVTATVVHVTESASWADSSASDSSASTPSADPALPGSTDERPSAVADVRITSGQHQGLVTTVQIIPAIYDAGLDPGDRIRLYEMPSDDSTASTASATGSDSTGADSSYEFASFDRTVPLVILVAVFVALLVVVAGRKGLFALLGLAFAVVVLVVFTLPALVAGGSPLLVALVTASLVLTVVLYTTHGFSARTTTALLGTFCGIGVAGILGAFLVSWMHLTGIGSEDDVLLWASAPALSLPHVLLCAIVITAIGVLNDVTITQSSAVWELEESSNSMSPRELLLSALRIGKDHVASSVYTLVFAATGSGLVTYLLLVTYQRNMIDTISSEGFSTELVMILVGAIAVLLAMPLTTLLAVMAVVHARRHRDAENTGDDDKIAMSDSATDVDDNDADI